MLSLGAVVGCGKGGANTAFASGGDSALVGRWVAEGLYPRNFLYNVDILKDGIVVYYDHAGNGVGGTWRAEGGRLYIVAESSSKVYDYKISGTTLTFTHGRESATYKKGTRWESPSRGYGEAASHGWERETPSRHEAFARK